MVKAVAEIIKQLIEAHEKNEDVDLNRMKNKTSAKFELSIQPRLTDIISAVPIQYKKILLPQLRAKPVRTARLDFGSFSKFLIIEIRLICLQWNCRGRSHVQTASLSTHFLYGKYLRLLSRRAGFGL